MIVTRRPTLGLVELVVTVSVLVCSAVTSQAADVIWTGAAGDNNWNTGTNWTGSFVPDAQFEEVGVINNGNTAFIAAATPSAAGLVLGQAAGNVGGLEVRSGGSIGFVDSTGAPDGSIIVGQDGQGALTIKPGGSATGTSLNVNGQSSLTIGSTAAGTASLIVSGPVDLNGSTRIIGAGHTFSGTSIALGGGSNLIAQITSTNHSPISSTGGATVGGGFKLEFGGGFTPSAGNKWNIVDAISVGGTFANIDLSAVPTPGPGTAYQFATVTGGAHGRLLQLQLNARIQLTVNTDTGAVSMSSPSGTAFNIDGYSILSSSGLLNAGQWNSLHDQSFAGWQEATPTSTALSELNANIGGSLNVGVSNINLGTPYTTPAILGVAPDIRFKYSSPTGETVQGLVNYTGSATVNNLLLTVDPATGNAQLSNSSKTSIPLVGYSILSQSGSLLPNNGDWLSLKDQNLSGWLEANPTTYALNEIFGGAGATTLSPGQSLSLGGLFNEVSGTRDLVLQFGLNGELNPRYGVVQYAAIAAGIAGDYDHNGKVDAADYVWWRKNDGTPVGYNTWRAHFGATAGSGAIVVAAAVPEPASWLVLIAGATCLLSRRKHKALA